MLLDTLWVMTQVQIVAALVFMGWLLHDQLPPSRGLMSWRWSR